MFVNRGEGGGKYTVRYPSFFRERGLRWFCHCWVHDFSAYIPFLHLEIALHQEETEESTSHHKNSGYADGEEELRKRCCSGPRCCREATHSSPRLVGNCWHVLTSGEGGGKVREENWGRGLPWGATHSVEDGKCSHLPSRKASWLGLLESILSPVAFF